MKKKEIIIILFILGMWKAKPWKPEKKRNSFYILFTVVSN